MAKEVSSGTEPMAGDGARIGLGNLAALGGEAQHGQAGFRSEQGEFGFEWVGFGVDWPRRISSERKSGYDRNAAGQREFWAGSSGLVETGVDSGGWRPPMLYN